MPASCFTTCAHICHPNTSGNKSRQDIAGKRLYIFISCVSCHVTSFHLDRPTPIANCNGANTNPRLGSTHAFPQVLHAIKEQNSIPPPTRNLSWLLEICIAQLQARTSSARSLTIIGNRGPLFIPVRLRLSRAANQLRASSQHPLLAQTLGNRTRPVSTGLRPLLPEANQGQNPYHT